MAAPTPTNLPPKNVTPQATGFSQVQPRNTAEGQGGNMGVFLSWHEKVRFSLSKATARSLTRHLSPAC